MTENPTCTVVVGGDQYICGRPAVTSFVSRSGVTYWECEEHQATPTAATPRTSRTSRKRTYEVTLPDGETRTRTTETKHYTFAVVVRDGVLRWSESYESAAKYARTGYPARIGAYVVPVRERD